MGNQRRSDVRSPLDILVNTKEDGGYCSLDYLVKSGRRRAGDTMAGREKAVKMRSEETQLLQGTLDMIVLRTLKAMGPQHAYQIATRLEQVSEKLLSLNQGTLYPALVRLEQYGWIKGEWGRTENNREAKFYAITKAGVKALGEETARWRQMMGMVERLLNEEFQV